MRLISRAARQKREKSVGRTEHRGIAGCQHKLHHLNPARTASLEEHPDRGGGSASRIRFDGELLKLGFEVAQWSVAKYMVKRRKPPGQRWLTFLRNHAPEIAAVDFFVVSTIGFNLLYAFVIVRIDLIWINVTRNPTAEWVARQITEAFPWDDAPGYMIRDRDRTYGTIVTRRLRAMGIRDMPTALVSPWQNGFADRQIGSIRHEYLDHIVVFGEADLHRLLRFYARYYNDVRTHRSLDKDAPVSRAVQRTGSITSLPIPKTTPSLIRSGLGFRYTQACSMSCRDMCGIPQKRASSSARSFGESSVAAGGRLSIALAGRCGVPPLIGPFQVTGAAKVLHELR